MILNSSLGVLFQLASDFWHIKWQQLINDKYYFAYGQLYQKFIFQFLKNKKEKRKEKSTRKIINGNFFINNAKGWPGTTESKIIIILMTDIIK